jgi:pseudouridine synthase
VADPRADKTLQPWLDRYPERLFPVGRLDRDSEGLLLLTNDGDLAFALTHPRHEHEKEYRVSVAGIPTPEILDLFRRGVALDDGITAPARVEDVRISEERARFTLILREGRNRQIRRMCEAVGLRVIRLIRRRVGSVELTGLNPGDTRDLTARETAALRAEYVRPAPTSKDPGKGAA